MDIDGLLALRGSIEKWKKIVAGTGDDRGGDNCPLCERFNEGDGDCGECPIAEANEEGSCRGTPYVEWANNVPMNAKLNARHASTPEQIKLAQAELDFLIELLLEVDDDDV